MRKNKLKRASVIVLSALMSVSLAGCAFGKKEEPTTEEVYVRPSTIGETAETTLKINPNGTFIEIACEDFSGTDIDAKGAESYINSEIDAFNDEAGVSKISLIEFQEEDGVVKTAIQYSDVASYNAFNMMDITVALYDAASADDILRAELASAQDASQSVTTTVETTDINEEELLEAGYSLEDIEEIESGSMDLEGTATETDAIATFTDANTLSVVNSDEIESASYMMIITSEPMVYSINGGRILYYDKHAELIDSATVRVNGTGKSVIVYEFNY